MRCGLLTLAVLLVASVFFVSCEQQPSPTFERKSNSRRVGDLGIIVSANRGPVDKGEPVELRFTVVNDGDEKQVIELVDEPVMDIMVCYRLSDDIRVYWSDGREVTAEMRRLELDPGESKTIDMIWIAEGSSFTDAQIYGILNDEYREYRVSIWVCIDSCGGDF
jgi:hypothetical protein